MKPNDDVKCGVCDTPVVERNNYFYGKQLTVRDLIQEQNYLNEKRRLINRAVLGWGVVCGLEVSWDAANTKITVCPGLAMDCCGHEILVCHPADVPFDDYAAIGATVGKTEPGKTDYQPVKYVLCLSYFQCDTEPVDLPPVGCGCEPRSEYNRIRESFRIKLLKWEDTCLAHPPQPVSCPSHIKKPVNADDAQGAPCNTETVHEYLCGRIKHCPECYCHDCVILATIEISPPLSGTVQPGGSPPSPVLRLDSCTYRKLVYRIPLLFDLIDCYHGDLPHIVDFSWRKDVYPSRQITFEKFDSMIRTGLTVTFDAKMDEASLNEFTFLVAFLREEENTPSVYSKRIPCKTIECHQEGNCFIAKFVVEQDWIIDQLEAKNSELADGVNIEITLRGSLIHSIDGKALDGEFINNSLPTGNGTQGGDFVDYFIVGKRGYDKPPAPKYDKF
jgi:hypothetical protein